MSEGAPLKIVAIGDAMVGKSTLLFSYAKNEFPTQYNVTVFESYELALTVNGQRQFLTIFDTAGQEDYSKLRYFCYPKTELFMVCFSVVDPQSFENVKNKWIPDIENYFVHLKHKMPKILLVGTKVDLRYNPECLQTLAKKLTKPIRFEQGEQLAREKNLAKYVECSALTQYGLKNVFDEAILAVLPNLQIGGLEGKGKNCGCLCTLL